MNCQQTRKLIQAHYDRELDIASSMEIDGHLADCPDCLGILRNLSALRAVLQNEALRYSPPPGFQDRCRLAASQAFLSERDALLSRRWLQPMAWGVAAIAVILTMLAVLLRGPGDEDRLFAELSASHIRSLMGDHLMDVASTDQHTVKPWFDGKLDFAPTVRDLRESGFPLLGGRLDYIAQRPVAALVYGRDKHFINLFVWPANSKRALYPRASERNGYNLVRWSSNDMAFAAVSDLNERELLEFARTWSGTQAR
jgi:anti-sigma factor RsiW